MVASGDVSGDDGQEDDDQQYGYDGDTCHDTGRMMADAFPLGLLMAEDGLSFVFDGGKQLMDLPVQLQAIETEMLDAVVEFPLLFLLGVRHSALHVLQEGDDGVRRIIAFGDGVGVFFLDGIVHDGGILLRWSEDFAQPA